MGAVMKKYALVIFMLMFVFMLSACGGRNDNADPLTPAAGSSISSSSTATGDTPEALLSRFESANNNRDLQALMDLYDPNANEFMRGLSNIIGGALGMSGAGDNIDAMLPFLSSQFQSYVQRNDVYPTLRLSPISVTMNGDNRATILYDETLISPNGNETTSQQAMNAIRVGDTWYIEVSLFPNSSPASNNEPAPTSTIQFEPILVSSESELRAAIGQSGSAPTAVILTDSIELISNFVIPANSTIKLTSEGGESFRLTATRDMDAITIEANASLTLEHIIVVRTLGTSGRGVVNRGTFIMESGAIRGHSSSGQANNAGGVSNIGTGVFIMNGGEISLNTNSNVSGSGGGVFNSGTFIMNEGSIHENTANRMNRNGGGIYNTGNNGTFTMNGGVIQNNFGGQRNGGVSNGGDGTFIMNGGVIQNNNGSHGEAGVSNSGGSFTMYGGIIDGGVSNSVSHTRVIGTFVMRGGLIRGSQTGGVVNGGNFTMYDGEISGNEDSGVRNTGTFTMHGGAILNNRSEQFGGGVRTQGNATFTMTGGVIYNNTTLGIGGGAYIGAGTALVGSGTFNFDGGWIFDNIANRNDDVYIGSATRFTDNVFNIDVGAMGSPPSGFVHEVIAEPIVGTVTVHIVGAVVNSGAFEVPLGSRISDVIERAGGATSYADLAQINLATVVSDAMQIFIPSLESLVEPTTYIVMAGDTLARIANMFYGNANADTINFILETNDLINASEIYVGQELIIVPIVSGD